MRDHHAFGARLRARWMRAARPLRGVDRVFAASAARVTSVRRSHTQTRVAFATVVNAPRDLHTIVPAPVAGATRTVIHGNVRGDGRTRPPASDRGHEMHTFRPKFIVVQRVLASERRETTVVCGRQETRVAGIACVVPKPAPARGPADEVVRPVAARTPPSVPWAAPPPISPLAGPTPRELAAITDHVLTAIDRRLIAHNERLGRG
jgi:hypothetical protein